MIKHLKDNHESYFGHIKFAWTIAFHMLLSSCLLLIHGAIPFFSMPKPFSIQGMCHKMKKWDAYLKIKQVPRKKK